MPGTERALYRDPATRLPALRCTDTVYVPPFEKEVS